MVTTAHPNLHGFNQNYQVSADPIRFLCCICSLSLNSMLILSLHLLDNVLFSEGTC